MIRVTTNAQQYSAALRRYADETGKEFSVALAREAKDFSLALYQGFRSVRPSPDSISQTAAANLSSGRGVYRRDSSVSPTDGGLSRRAVRKAVDMLGGRKSDYFMRRGGVDGRFSLAKFSLKSGRAGEARGPGVMRGHIRTGYIAANRGLRAYQLTPDQLTSALARHASSTPQPRAEYLKDPARPRLMNLRALSVYYELLFRRRAAAGGTMALQWLNDVYRRKTGTFVPRTADNLIQRTATGVKVGEVNFMSLNGKLSAVEWVGSVPGTTQVDSQHGIVNSVFAARGPALIAAIAKHHQKARRIALAG